MARTIRAMSDHLPPCVLENLQQRLECLQLVLVQCLREAQESSQQQTHAVQTDGSSIDVPDRQPILRREHTGARAPTEPGARPESLYERMLRTQIAEVHHALAKFKTGQYGLCERCGKPIPLAQLQEMPWLRFDYQHEAVLGEETR